jgi:hypothetical protein
MFTIGGGTAQVLRVLVTSKMLGWKPADPGWLSRTGNHPARSRI